MSSIERLDFRCCQQTRVIYTEGHSIHQALNTVPADTEVLRSVLGKTINDMLLSEELYNAAAEHFCFFSTQKKKKPWN